MSEYKKGEKSPNAVVNWENNFRNQRKKRQKCVFVKPEIKEKSSILSDIMLEF